ncbi:futalosine hydrolase [Niabella beijingensis]|uniref:futalosine hydrolase n=1 Tax=Niabella beijingensis TaxID=2872700 RepID=UPI001CBE5F77|nr:futalosine hydrolase [Niabella beijingensis]MBZ4188398.1 futalosine hydrolase [Niabella beijingensis]
MSKRILLVAATELELAPLRSFLEEKEQVTVLVAGIGGVSTAYGLTRQLARERYDLVLQAGIGGSLVQQYAPGSIAVIDSECFGDLGVNENGQWRSVFDLGLAVPDDPPFTKGWLRNPYEELMALTRLNRAKGVTNNEITTREDMLRQFKDNLRAEIESMEGAAFHYVALNEGVPFLQIRAVSNYVGERDKAKWKLRESISLLNATVQQLITVILQ